MKILRVKIFKNSKSFEKTVIFLFLSFVALIVLCVWFYNITTQVKYARILCFVSGGLYLALLYYLEKRQKAKRESWSALAASAVKCWDELYRELRDAEVRHLQYPYDYAHVVIKEIVFQTKDSIIKENSYIDICSESASKRDLCLLIMYCCVKNWRYYDGAEQYYDLLISKIVGPESAELFSYDDFSRLKTEKEKIDFVNSAYNYID